MIRQRDEGLEFTGLSVKLVPAGLLGIAGTSNGVDGFRWGGCCVFSKNVLIGFGSFDMFDGLPEILENWVASLASL